MEHNDKLNSSDFQDEESHFKLVDIYFIFKGNWYWFLISAVICLSIGSFYIKKTPRIYTCTASILIKDNSRGVGLSETVAFGDINMFQSKSNLDNEIFIMRSAQLMKEVARRLNLDITYSIKKGIRLNELYTQTPLALRFLNSEESDAFSFDVTILSKKKFKLSNFSGNPNKTLIVDINDTIITPSRKFILIPTLYYTDDYIGSTIHIRKENLESVAQYYRNSVKIGVANQAANIIYLTLLDKSLIKAKDVINTLIAVYNEETINNKNQLAINTSQFINDRLIVIEKDLSSFESSIASYKSEKKIVDISSEIGIYVQDSREYNKEGLGLENQLGLIKYMRQYLTDPKNNSKPIPSNAGITDSNIESQISAYNNLFLERTILIENGGEKNPVIMDMNNSLQAMKQSIIQTVDNMIMSIDMKIKNNREQEDQTSRRISSMPTQQKEILSAERQQKIKEELYLYLLNKREESVLSQAMTESNARVIDPASGPNSPVAPQKQKILIMALFIGLAIPALILFLLNILNVNVRNRKDLERIITIPLLGDIPLKNKKDKEEIVVQEDKQDPISEAFRIIRTNLYFMQTKEDKSHQVVMFTSFNPAAGKTFISTNLAMSFSLTDKKVILIDLDIRKRTLSNRTNHNGKAGVTNFLSGMINSVDEIICEKEINGMLDIIHAGPVPPNPSELLHSNRLEVMIKELKKKYDYIFIDNVPSGMVADAVIVNRIADITIYVIRAGKTDRRILPELEKMYQQNRFKNLCLILNAVQNKDLRYGYGYGYGYGYNYE